MSSTSDHRFLRAPRTSRPRRAELRSRQGVRLRTTGFAGHLVPRGFDVPNSDRDKERDFEPQVSQGISCLAASLCRARIATSSATSNHKFLRTEGCVHSRMRHGVQCCSDPCHSSLLEQSYPPSSIQSPRRRSRRTQLMELKRLLCSPSGMSSRRIRIQAP